MNIGLFNRNYWVRRFGPQKAVKGYLVSDHTDFVASLHVHPSGSTPVSALPEGERKMSRLEGHGNIELYVADEARNRKGDLLYFNEDWYECISAQEFNHTILGHWNYSFVLVPKDASRSTDLEPRPNGNPGMSGGGSK